MIVYVVEEGVYESRYVSGVFASLEAAQAAHPGNEWDDRDGWWHNGKDWDFAVSIRAYELVEGESP